MADGAKRPIVKSDFQIPHPTFGKLRLIGTHSESNNIDASGLPTVAKEARRFYYFPFLALKKSTNGSIEIKEPTPGNVIITLILDLPNTTEIFQRFLLDNFLISDTTNPGNIQMAGLLQLTVRTDRAYRFNINFIPIEVQPGATEVQISTNIVDQEIRRQFIEEFGSGLVSLEAQLLFEGYETSQNVAILSYEQLRQTSTYTNISGAGGQGNVTRNKIGNLAQEAILSNNIFIRTEFEDPDFQILVSNLLSKLNSSQLEISADFANIQSQFSAAGIRSDDFAADVITSSKYIENRENQRKFSEEINRHRTGQGSVNARADILGIVNAGGDASGSYTADDARKVMEDVYSKYGIEYEFNGRLVIPKSIKVYLFEDAKLRSAGTFVVGNAKILKTEGSFKKTISPDIHFFTFEDFSQLPIELEIRQVGFIEAFGGQNIPVGYLLCDGKEYDRVLYKSLFDTIGSFWGEASVPTHFKVPDLRTQILKGAGDLDTVGTSQIYATAMPRNPFVVTAENSSHGHTIPVDITDSNDYGPPAARSGLNAHGGFALVASGAHTHGFSGGDEETRPNNKWVNYVIKYK